MSDVRYELHLIGVKATDRDGNQWQLAASGETFKKAAEASVEEIKKLEVSVGEVVVDHAEARKEEYPIKTLNLAELM